MHPLKREWRYLSGLVRTLLRVRSIAPGSANLATDDLEAAVDQHRERPAIRFQTRQLSYGAMDDLANRYAHWALARGLRPGETVAVLLPNRLEYLPLWFGLSKVGVVAALINNQLTGEALRHCLELSGAQLAVVDASTAGAFTAAARGGIRSWDLDRDLGAAAAALSAARPAKSARGGMTASDTCLLIYTSGTTGLPKAARINHMRAQLYMRGFAGATGARPSDRLYLTLPLYHATGGLCAAGAALLNGACLLVRDSFSASHFWDEIRAEAATIFVYVGELCRYLVNQPRAASERAHSLRLAFGNGLSRDIWGEMEDRFAVPRILEFYGSTEGNVYLFNFDGGHGAVGRIAPYLAPMFNVTLARFDVETEAPVRGPGGRCVACAPGEVGECLGAIHGDARSAFSGYVDKAASEQKVLRNAFRKNDAWFRTGDLMTRDRQGYFYFVDRIGDTFRWKGENVSTHEVAQTLLTAPGVMEAVVYGVTVPAHEGRAGMAALVTSAEFSLQDLRRVVEKALPAYAQPLFLRLMPQLSITGTFKPLKTELTAQGFDPAKVSGPLYLHSRELGFVPLGQAVFDLIESGEARL
ncbi:MAG TPA: long-chain-acyl-CoA synthetase [Caulobacteraceae bacterium]|nr:long-chain-acyl-CoA synthetase [Caulobacteraceae bacterium]